MGNGITQNSRMRELSEAANQAVNCIKINSITFERRQGKPMWVKRRRWGSELIAGQANLFFRLAQGRVHVWVDPKKWQRWEIPRVRRGFANRLHGCNSRNASM
jgi:hypothetical protein